MDMFGGFWIDVTVGFVAGFVVAVVTYIGSHDMKADATSHSCLGNPAYIAPCDAEKVSHVAEIAAVDLI